MKQQESFKNNILIEKSKTTTMMQMVQVLYEKLVFDKKNMTFLVIPAYGRGYNKNNRRGT